QLNELLQETGVKKLGIESKSITYFQYLKYDDHIDTEIIPTHNLVEKLRMVKDKFELKMIQKAVDITDQAFKYICRYIYPGLTERELALELEFFLKKMGAEKNAFDFIVASGQRSALPHGVASDKLIEFGDFVTFDFGVFYQGYCSDMTRTVVIGEPTIEQEKVYNIVLDAQLAVIEKIQAGMNCKDVDGIARDIISESGYADNFGHGLGHGIGLEIHEGPRLSFSSDEVLETGMVVTDEPGIYIPEWGGVRIEDDLYITDEGCKVLNSSPKELLVINN
ncbi:MAG: M24 family metallopeptidase, partial [Bacillota bacterium]